METTTDIVIATPGRLLDMVNKGTHAAMSIATWVTNVRAATEKISLSVVAYLCFDEADRMLDMVRLPLLLFLKHVFFFFFLDRSHLALIMRLTGWDE